MFQKLELVDNSRSDWSIRVRITRMWPSFDENQHFVGFNLILLDSENYHVHAKVYPIVWNSLGNMILEGNAYDIQNFRVREPMGLMRPVSSDKAIVFTFSTHVQPVPLEVITIPRHKFEIVELGAVYDLASSYDQHATPQTAIDVVGAVQNMDQPRHVNTKFGQRTFVRFQLFDGRDLVNFTAWDDHTQEFGPLFQGHIDNPPIVIVSTVRPCIFRGRLQVSTSRTSRILINVDYEAVRVLRQRLTDQGYEANVLAP